MDLSQFASDIRHRSELLAEVVRACQSLLWHSPVAEPYLTYLRGRLTKSEIKRNNIGFFPPNQELDLLNRYLSERTLRELRLVYDASVFVRGHADYVKSSIFHYHNLIFPFSDEYGNIITLAGRTILGEGEREPLKIPKYKNAPFKKQMHLYGLHRAGDAIEEKNGVIIVEGQIDCIKCHANGFSNTVSLNGSELAMTQVFLLKRKTDNFHLVLDSDSAGQKAINKIKNNYSKYVNFNIIKIPAPYKDVDDYLTKSSDHSLLDGI